MEQGIKDSQNKLNYELDWDFIKAMAERMALNKDKYPAYNWKQPIDLESLRQSLFRHVIEVMSGKYDDEEDELGHLKAIALNAQFLFNQMQTKEEPIIAPKVTGLHRVSEPTPIKYGPTPGLNPPINISTFTAYPEGTILNYTNSEYTPPITKL